MLKKSSLQQTAATENKLRGVSRGIQALQKVFKRYNSDHPQPRRDNIHSGMRAGILQCSFETPHQYRGDHELLHRNDNRVSHGRRKQSLRGTHRPHNRSKNKNKLTKNNQTYKNNSY